MKQILKKASLLVAASAMGVLSTSASLAGGDTYESRPAIWNGVYAGAHIGGGFGEITAEGEDGSIDVDGVVGGVHLGYNYQSGKTVIGIEGDFSWSGAEVDIPGADVDQSYLASIRGRLGYAHNNTLLFATAGVAWTELEGEGDSETFAGYVFGIGAEHKFSSKWSIKGELLRYGFEEDFEDETLDLDQTVVRAGITMHLN